ncbi:MAG TPA: hypothetical protein VD994_00170, partial [Prosthecobacter sp.]|nr:hypothetical protein [Prosthecobacter sp.]
MSTSPAVAGPGAVASRFPVLLSEQGAIAAFTWLHKTSAKPTLALSQELQPILTPATVEAFSADTKARILAGGSVQEVQPLYRTANWIATSGIVSPEVGAPAFSTISGAILEAEAAGKLDLTLASFYPQPGGLLSSPHLGRIVQRSILRGEQPHGNEDRTALIALYGNPTTPAPIKTQIAHAVDRMRFSSMELNNPALAAAFPTKLSGLRRAAGASDVIVKDDQFEKSVTFLGTSLSHGTPYLGVADTNKYRIRSWLNKDTGAATHQIYVEHHYDGDWVFWNSASDENAKTLEFLRISADVISCSGGNGCAHVEHF